MKHISSLDKIYAFEIVSFFLIIFGIVPRWWALVLACVLVVYSIATSLEDATTLFVRSIPLFIALPITHSFDNFNTWRIVSLVIFLRWAIVQYQKSNLKIQNDNIKIKILFISLLCISAFSIFVAADTMIALKRLIYFINLSFVAIVAYDLIEKHQDYGRRIIQNFIPPLIIVLAVGFFQLASTYFFDIYQFIGFWGSLIQCLQFGSEWCSIAINQGNTWFAYNSFGQINLRMFSLFTDSHTFPMYILMTIPAVFAYASERINFTSLKTAVRTRARLFVLLVPLGFLAAILSNTRGIWLAGWGITLVALVTAIAWHRTVIRYLTGFLIIYLLMFAFVYPLSATPQFHLWAGQATLGSRIHSIIDFSETSNKLRLAIWKASALSTLHHQLLGVGIGNFPSVLGQDISLAKAGSSAHNLYLQIGAELGIPALLIALALLWIIFKRAFDIFKKSSVPFDQLYFGALLIVVPWLYAYLMTDAALFDERAFLMFSILAVTILGYEQIPTSR